MRKFLLLVTAVLVMLGFWLPPALGQDNLTLTLNVPTNGTISPDVPQQTWRFEIAQAQTVSLDVTRTNGTALLIAIVNRLDNTDTPLQLVKARSDNFGRVLVPQLYLESGSYGLTVTGDLVSGGGETINYQVLVSSFGTQPAPAVITPTATSAPTINSPATTAPSTNPTVIANAEIGVSGFPLVESGERLEFGQVREGALEIDGDTHEFAFFGNIDMVVTISFSRMDENATFDPYLRVQAPDGTVIAENDDVSVATIDSVITGLTLTSAGVYTIIAGSVTGIGTGDYLIGVGLGVTIADVERATIGPDAPQTATLEFYGARDRWSIGLQAGDVISIAVNRVDSDTFDPMVELVAPGGASIAFDDDGGGEKNALISNLTIEQTGLYIIHVASFGNGELGTYELRWTRGNIAPTVAAPTATSPAVSTPSPTVAIVTVAPTFTRTPTVTQPPTSIISPTPSRTPTQTATLFATSAPILGDTGSERGTVAQGGTYERQIDLEAGDSLFVFVEGYWGFDGVLEVVDPIGIIFETVDDVGFDTTFDRNPRLTVIIPASGRYTLRVYGYDGNAGEFSLNWRVQ